MKLKIIFTFLIVSFLFALNAQITAVASFNETRFCGLNSVLQMQDVSTGNAVDNRTWLVTGPFGFTQFNGTNATENVTLTEFGTYTVRLMVCDAMANCDTEFYTNFIEVFEAPNLNLTLNSLCVNNPNEFYATILPFSLDIDSFIWNFDEGAGKFNGDSLETYAFIAPGNKNLSLEIVSTDGCRDTVIQNINVFNSPTAVIDAQDTIVCVGNTVNFSGINSIYGTAGITYSWDTDFNTGIDNNNASVVLLANTDKTVMLYVEDDNACSDSAFQDLQIIQVPNVNFTSPAQCANTAFNLNAEILSTGGSPIDSIYWYIDSTIYEIGQSVTYTHPVKDSIPIILFAINEEGCADGLRQYVLIDTLVNIDVLTNDTLVCKGEEITLRATGNANLLWLPDSVNTNTFLVTPEENTVYNLLGISGNGACPNASKKVLVEVLDEPEFVIDASSYSVGLGTPVNFDVSYTPFYSNRDSLHWLLSTSNNVLEFEYGLTNSFVAQETETFQLELFYNKDETKCVYNSSTTIEVNENCSAENIYIPNVFTPDNNGTNDFLQIKAFGIQQLDLFVVYNRTGQEVFIAENVTFNNGLAEIAWDGNHKNGKKCNSGVYVYAYQSTCINGVSSKGSGNISLIR